MSCGTARSGLNELESDTPPPESIDDTPPLEPGRSRQPAGGRKRATDQNPALVPALERQLEPLTRGDPESPLLWTSKSAE